MNASKDVLLESISGGRNGLSPRPSKVGTCLRWSECGVSLERASLKVSTWPGAVPSAKLWKAAAGTRSAGQLVKVWSGARSGLKIRPWGVRQFTGIWPGFG